MLRSLKEIMKYRIAAIDGEIGSAKDFYFDDHTWAIRYLVADTGHWLTGRQVLLSPVAIASSDWSARQLHVNLSKDQIEKSPGIEADRPVSRQMEYELGSHFGWPIYWGGPVTPARPVPATAASGVMETDRREGDPSLHSVHDVRGYHIEASDGSIGHVDDFIATDEDWVIRYMIVDTRNWLPGRKVLVAPWMVQAILSQDRKVQVDLTQEQIKGSPKYDPATAVNREYEAMYYDYYGRPAYWSM
jgi:hypothetical protein